MLNPLQFLSWENDLSRYQERTVVATFTPALTRIQQTAPDAGILLRFLCFCDPECIPISIFTQGGNEDVQGSRHFWKGLSFTLRGKRKDLRQNKEELKLVQDLFQSRSRLLNAIQEIQRLSLAACASEGGDHVIRIHDLIHLLLRSKLMATNAERVTVA